MNMPVKMPPINENVKVKGIEEDKELHSQSLFTSFMDNINNKKEEEKEEVKMVDFFKRGLETLDEFDTRAKTKGKGYKSPKFPLIEEMLEGWESGLYIFAGESNSGKSAAMMNIIKDLCSCEDNYLYGIYYSLDDTKHEIIPRIIAMEQSIPIGIASKPKRYQELLENTESMNDSYALIAEQLEKREIGLNKLRKDVASFTIEDFERIKNSTDITNHIKMVKAFLKTHYTMQGKLDIAEKVNVIVAIDSLNDIKLDPKVYGRVKKDETSEEIAKFIKNLAVTFDIIVLASSHLRKLNGNRRPTLDDLREANTLVYESSVVWLVYNDVSKNKSGAKVYWEHNQERCPILEMDWAKNKKSSYKGRTFNLFRPEWSQIKECKKEQMKIFENLILQS